MARWYDLATEEDTGKILKARRPEVELIFTGRNAPKEILDAADLITEMKRYATIMTKAYLYEPVLKIK